MKWREGGDNCVTRICVIVSFAKYNYNDHVEEDELGGACSMNGARMNRCMLLVGKPEGKRPLGRPKCR
jgi:hypothetical protein